MYDFLVVGAGCFGASFARLAAENGACVLVIDRRDHLAGNCYTSEQEGIHVHEYGAHIFHTNDERVWAFVNRFARFNAYRHKVFALRDGQAYPMPISLATLNRLWGVTTPEEAVAHLEAKRLHIVEPKNLEEWALSRVGPDLYELLIKGYTTKQWNTDPKNLPASIIKRLPIRLTYQTDYFDDRYQGIPAQGYTALFDAMLDHPRIETRLGIDYFEHKPTLSKTAHQLVYTGPLDRIFDYRFGKLPYRSLRFEHTRHSQDVQGTAVINHTGVDVPYTRTIEHRHFMMGNAPRSKSILTHEYPAEPDSAHEPYYPIQDQEGIDRARLYRDEAARAGVIAAGRLGSFRYMDMDTTIAQAMATAKRVGITTLSHQCGWHDKANSRA